MAGVHLFATTWNMGGVERDDVIEEGVLEDCVTRWIPKDYDLYVSKYVSKPVNSTGLAHARHGMQCLPTHSHLASVMDEEDERA